MIRTIYENIQGEKEVRKHLIELRKLLKETNNRMAFLYLLAGDYRLLYKLLEDEDAKVRKNVALIMGHLQVPDFMNKLFESYLKEEKLFIRSDYLAALREFDYTSLLEALKNQLEALTSREIEESNQKHINEEKKLLSELILAKEKPSLHSFTGYDQMSDVILLTNRDHKAVTLEQIHYGKAREFNAGIVAKTDDLRELLAIRTYSELLFRLPKVDKVSHDPMEAAQALYEGGLLDFIGSRHKGNDPFYFRIELKTKMPLDKKSSFAKKMATKLEDITQRQLINSTSHYEIEIRLVENKEGLFNVLLKLYTIKDERFSYRKGAVAASIAPVSGALVARLSKDYLKENAQVLDPFCGVGTMLIERNKCVRANPMYGIDSYGEAIEKATQNAALDDTRINFINRDFFDFKHDYLFDEIFTNMPTETGRKTVDEIKMLYRQFFDKALEVLKDEAVIVMYTRNKTFVEEALKTRSQYTLLKEYTFSKKEDAYVYILKVTQ